MNRSRVTESRDVDLHVRGSRSDRVIVIKLYWAAATYTVNLPLDVL